MSFEPPRVWFFVPSGKPIPHGKVAYLVRVNGQPWAFADPAEIHKDPRDANAVRLDEQHLQEYPAGESGQKAYVYSGPLSAFPKGLEAPR